MTSKVILADDHTMFRQALGLALAQSEDIELVGEASDGKEALQLAEEFKPDVMVLDVSMPRTNGIDACRKLQSLSPNTKVIILSRYSSQDKVIQALKAGAAGYILKSDAVEELRNGIDTVQKDQIYLSPPLVRPIVEGYLEWVEQSSTSPVKLLTEREREVLQLVAGGKSSADIAEELEVMVRTVETHRANLMSKLGLRNVADVVRFAFEHELILTED
ncbi:MAG: response regulator transcription factor [Chloroflexota bacterium]